MNNNDPILLKILSYPKIDFTGIDKFELAFQADLKGGKTGPNNNRFFTTVDEKVFLTMKKDIKSKNPNHTISFDLKGISELAESLSKVNSIRSHFRIVGINRKTKDTQELFFDVNSLEFEQFWLFKIERFLKVFTVKTIEIVAPKNTHFHAYRDGSKSSKTDDSSTKQLWVMSTIPLETNELLMSFVNNPSSDTKPELTTLLEQVVKFVMTVSNGKKKDVVTISFNISQVVALSKLIKNTIEKMRIDLSDKINHPNLLKTYNYLAQKGGN